MFRLTRYMRLLAAPPSPNAPNKRPAAAVNPTESGPVVIWNLVRRCNLSCLHCYAFSADHDFSGELSLDEVFRVMDDLWATGVRVLILSGGEPLMRPDAHQIGARAKAMGFYVGLSSNGTLMDEARVKEVAAVGYDYVGVSLDGLAAVNDQFRRKAGAFDAALNGLRLCRDAGLKTGLRLTLTETTARDLDPLLDLMAEERFDKFYLSHLNYAGRGDVNRKSDALHRTTRQAMDTLFERALADVRSGADREYVTGNNDADGVYLLHWARRRFPERAAALEARLRKWGGNASGVGIANIDTQGIVHPDTMWSRHDLGDVRKRPFGEIWADVSNPLMAALKISPRPVTGRCGTCGYLQICNGNTRVRAESATGDPWAADPGCYLTDTEIQTAADQAAA
jgi:Fe-coproporphyrin III synthase